MPAKLRTIVTEASVPGFAPGVRLRHDWARQRNVLLAPERVIALDNIASHVLERCDGSRPVSGIVEELQQIYPAERAVILSDVRDTLQELLDKRYLLDVRESRPERRAVLQKPAASSDSRPAGPISEGMPISVLAELTHRCPLKCPYCSNPLQLERAGAELSTEEWKRLMREMAGLGVLQIHFSGGEPLVRKDLVALVAEACANRLYTNLITSGVLLDAPKADALARAGLDHVQISFQGAQSKSADAFAGLSGAHAKKLLAARLVRDRGLSLTVNAVVHRQNLNQLPELIDMAVALGACRMEVAHVQYLGWALKNRAALIPTLEQFEEATRLVEKARERVKGILVIDYVIPDYYAVRPKKCMGGWGEQFFNITPSGKVLPCHAAESITGLSFDSVRERSLSWIWQQSPSMQKYRGTAWMAEPCKSCEYRERDRGGCRCQAFALAGDAHATDPACAKSSRHAGIAALAENESRADRRDFAYRNFSC